MKKLGVFSFILLLAAPAAAQQAGRTDARQPAPEASAGSGNAGDAERQICRRIESSTGTRLGGQRRVCMTSREWREYERNN